MCIQTYAVQEGPYQERAKEIYAELRKNVVDNVHKVRLPPCVVASAQPADTPPFPDAGVRPHGIRVGAVRRPHRRGPQEVRPRFSSLLSLRADWVLTQAVCAQPPLHRMDFARYAQ